MNKVINVTAIKQIIEVIQWCITDGTEPQLTHTNRSNDEKKDVRPG